MIILGNTPPFYYPPNSRSKTKTGGLSIESSPLFSARRKAVEGVGGHHSARSFLRNHGCAGYDIFAVARHPCSRLFVTWAYYSRNLGNSGDAAWGKAHLSPEELQNFTTFVTGLDSKRGKFHTHQHFRSQVGMMVAADGHLGVSKLLIFERWAESMKRLSELRSPPLESENIGIDGSERTPSG